METLAGWRSASRVAGLSVASLRRKFAQGKLKATRDAQGIYLFDRGDLDQLRRSAQGAAAARPPLSGEADADTAAALVAAVFTKLEEGMALPRIVVELHADPEVVLRVHGQWETLTRASAQSNPPEPRLQDTILKLIKRLGTVEDHIRALHQRLDSLPVRSAGSYECGACGETSAVGILHLCTACGHDELVGFFPSGES